jgi:hypothetical protein
MSEFWDVTADPVTVVDQHRGAPLLDLFPQTGSVAVVRLDGDSAPNEDTVFLSFYEGLRFPEYFGWNWDALSDCLRDLSWYAADRYLILIDHADRILADDRPQRRLLFSTLRRAAVHWADPMLNGLGHPVAFKVVLVCADADATEG